ncbi:Gypsy retrotransposon integrase-like protein 1 [Merluccius polli]|uniref:Gypsy retrotransposon integrase-like protein 1 n=1 Tax=Merluccius polli TaxID=89951 RepID=A0AA47MR40_MERPO|nr:Gypsy retrotransposon integrase-like protein 1 [Merluccius polli]
MDPQLHEDILQYKVNGKYKSDLTRAEKSEIRRKASRYHVEGGALYYIKGSGDVKTKVVCGVEEANAIFVDFHDSPTGAHSGQKKTRDAISKRFHWPGMTTDIDKWVAECAVCQSTQRLIKQEVQYTPIKV